MTPSLLRKRRNQPISNSQTGHSGAGGLRHSLSLPDLTTPLLDPASWEELPSLSAIPKSTTFSSELSNYTTAGGSSPPLQTPRARKVSIVNPHGSPVQFHRPFTPWQVVNHETPLSASIMGTTGLVEDFRTSRAKWGRDSVVTQNSGVGGLGKGWRRRGKSKVLNRLNVVVVGPKGCGKTSFIQLLIDSLQTHSRDSATSSTSHDTPCSPTSPGPPLSAISPTTKLSSRSNTISNESYERTQLRLIDTPGLASGDDILQVKERERGLIGLSRMMEERFAEVMREESRIVRKTTRGEDDIIHLVIFMIDARSVLHPTVDIGPVDWSCVDVLDEAEQSPSRLTHPLPAVAQSDIDAIRHLSNRADVLPILAYIDALTVKELEHVRAAVRRDLSSLPGGGFGIFTENDKEVDESQTEAIEPDKMSSPKSSDTRHPRPLTPASSIVSQTSIPMPFAIFNPERRDGEKFVRKFAWGEADLLDPDQSDFVALKDALLDTHAKALRMTTREVLYEKFRTEKLLESRRGKVSYSFHGYEAAFLIIGGDVL